MGFEMLPQDPPRADPDRFDPPERPVARRKREAEEWALVLTAEGYAPIVVPVDAGWSIEVEPDLRSAAWLLIGDWIREREERAAQAERARARADRPDDATTPFQTAAAYALMLALLVFHVGLELAGRHEATVELGASRAGRVMDGEIWRVVTALCLHADIAHAAGNTLFGGFFLAALSGRLGIGCAALAFLVSGALGNLANALYYGSDHGSIGASTGVFGLVGVLAGLAAWRRHVLAPPRRGAWVAIGAGLAIVAMLGTGGPRVDLSAHLFGLAAGAATGGLIALPIAGRPTPSTRIQIFALLLTAAILAAAWVAAAAHAGA